MTRLTTCEKCNGYGTYLYSDGDVLRGLQSMACNVCGGSGMVGRDELPFAMAKKYLSDFPKAKVNGKS